MSIDFAKGDGLVPAIVQDALSKRVLMLGYMNSEALEETRRLGKVTFYSRSKKRLWTKGESSGNFLMLKEIREDCDGDSLLVYAAPTGPACHTGSDTCFGESTRGEAWIFLATLVDIIEKRSRADDKESYTASLLQQGIAKVAQKVGEEATELVIEAMRAEGDKFSEEAADLLFHYLVLLKAKGISIDQVTEVLRTRHNERQRAEG